MGPRHLYSLITWSDLKVTLITQFAMHVLAKLTDVHLAVSVTIYHSHSTVEYQHISITVAMHTREYHHIGGKGCRGYIHAHQNSFITFYNAWDINE